MLNNFVLCFLSKYVCKLSREAFKIEIKAFSEVA